MKLKMGFVSFLLFVSVLTQAQTEEFVSDSGLCYAYCKLPIEYRTDTLQVLKTPEHKMVIGVPVSYNVFSDTIEIPVYDSAANYEPGFYDVQQKTISITGDDGIPHVFTYNELIVLQQPDTTFSVKPPLIFVTTNFTEDKKATDKKILIPAQFETVIDTQEVHSVKSYGYTQIICPKNETPDLIIQIKKMLQLHGFVCSNFSGEWTEEDEAMLEQYQKKNNLPVGHFNMLTLEMMGIL